MTQITLENLSTQIAKNHLDVSQRLTAIETMMTTAYEDIPDRVTGLEKKVSWIKGAGAVIGMLWAGLLTLLDIRLHR
ncbi:MAG TPA: hypothetical protein VFI60_05690 [Candidatus Acidoferrum sp.]|nr:hypothetical protein [Candidatus Acidoferrum sp.]